MKIEVCVNRIEDVIALQNFAVDRIELCIELGCGGLTPSTAMVERALEISAIPLHILVRPRSGHFVYSTEECQLMESDCLHFQRMGVAGLVVGALDTNRELPLAFLSRLRQQLPDLCLVFHRAFDEIAVPYSALDHLKNMGYDGVLTSGSSPRAAENISELAAWQSHTKERPFILPGGGINPQNCLSFAAAGFEWIHLSAKQQVLPPFDSPFNSPHYGLDLSVLSEVMALVHAL
ncbi:MAG: copper homeostasis protein CutC [Flavobacteriaceae bacterium]